MEIKTLEISPEDIDKYISNAVIESGIGKAVTAAIKEKISSNSWEFKKAIGDMVNQEIPKFITQVLREEDSQKMLKEKVREGLTEDVVDSIVGKALQDLIDKSKY